MVHFYQQTNLSTSQYDNHATKILWCLVHPVTNLVSHTAAQLSPNHQNWAQYLRVDVKLHLLIKVLYCTRLTNILWQWILHTPQYLFHLQILFSTYRQNFPQVEHIKSELTLVLGPHHIFDFHQCKFFLKLCIKDPTLRNTVLDHCCLILLVP